MNILSLILSFLVRLCYQVVHNYGIAIALFTLLTKVILFPVSMWVQKNSIKMVQLTPELNHLKVKYYGDKDTIAEETQKLYKKAKYHPLASTIPMFIQLILLIGVIGAVRDLLEGETASVLGRLPSELGGVAWLMPLAAGVAALLLGLAQNYNNPLQREQSKAEQWMTNGFSIAISLALGAFVPLGVGLYWIASNLLTIVQQILLNVVIPPKKYIDYEALEESKEKLREIAQMGSKKRTREEKQREKADYKRFFSIANKHLVFYSESSGFYKYFQGIIEELISRSNITIHYVTSDPNDQIFDIAQKQPQIRPYYIGEKKLITLMMKMDADIVAMTMPELEKYHIKRSYVRKDIQYIYIPHGMGSMNTELRAGALDHYDTVYIVNAQAEAEIRAVEKLRNQQHKRLVKCGYPLLDSMLKNYRENPPACNKKPRILIAPSWQPDNIMETCINSILNNLLGYNYQVILRPHPQYVRHHADQIAALKSAYSQYKELSIEDNFVSSESVYAADILITDWSNIGYEFCFTTFKPVLFIHTPMKTMNPDYQKISITSFAERLRTQVGYDLYPEDVDQIRRWIDMLLENRKEYEEKIEQISRQERYNCGTAAKVAANDILMQLSARRG